MQYATKQLSLFIAISYNLYTSLLIPSEEKLIPSKEELIPSKEEHVLMRCATKRRTSLQTDMALSST